VGFNDLATTNPDLASQMLTGDPTKVTAGRVECASLLTR
jgi:hypothetical protein